MQLLKGKRALISGGTSGIGRAIAHLFAKEGADVAIYGTNLEKAKKVADELQSHCVDASQKIIFESVDVSSRKSVKDAIERLLTNWGGLDILVNCAGITRDKLLLRMEESDWDDVLDVNLKSVFHLSQAVLRSMLKAKNGKIVNISSVIGLTGNPGQVNYSASKHGIIGFTKSLAKEVATKNISVNCVAPGFVHTPMTETLSDAQKDAILKKIPMARLGQPEEIARAVLFLASDMSNYITGQVLTVDGGMLA